MPARVVALVAIVVCWTLAAAPGLSAQLAPGGDEAEIITAPVDIDGTVLFRVRGVSSLPASERARRIRDRLLEVAGDSTVPARALRVLDVASVARIVAGDRLLMGITDADAQMEHVDRVSLAAAHRLRIELAIAEYRHARTPAALWRAGRDVLLATFVLALAGLGVIWAWRAAERLLARRLHARIHSVEIGTFEVMRAERIRAAMRSVLAAARTVLLLAIGLGYLGYVLSALPWTRGLSRDMAGLVLGPLGVIGSSVVAEIPSLVFLVVLFLVFRFLLRLVRLFFDAVDRGTVTLANFDREWAQPTYKILRVAIVAFGLVVAYPYIPGSESDAFKGVSLFIGIVFSLGSSSAIANIIAGYMMTYRRAFRVGDRVRIGNTVGDVIATRLQVTHLRSFKNEEIIVPNSQILGSEVLNYSSLARTTQGLILHTEVGIGYETPWRQVEAMLLLAAGRTPGLSDEPRPFVLQKKLGDFAVTYELNAYCTDVHAMNRWYTELHRNILDVFNEYGVQIMTPAYEADTPDPKVVPRGQWYAAPAAGPETEAPRPEPRQARNESVGI